MNIEADTQYSSQANPRIGYHDYDRTVTFEGGTPEERTAALDDICKRLRESGNMWVRPPKQLTADRWLINYGYDSGD